MRVAQDKLMHAAAGALVATVAVAVWFGLASAGLELRPSGAPVCAALTVVLQAVGNEVRDWLRVRAERAAGVVLSATPDAADAVVTVLGGLPIVLITAGLVL